MAKGVRSHGLNALVLILVAYAWAGQPDAFGASAQSALLKAKQEAESKGYVLFANHDEILSKAKNEPRLRVLATLEGSLKITASAFKKKYPFIDLQVENSRTVEESQRLLLQVKAGAAKDWDIIKTTPTFYSEWLPHLWKVDLLGMAEHRVLDIPAKMIDPKNRNVVALGARLAVVTYNKDLVSPGRLPKSWEDMLKPEWKGKKFANDINPAEIAALVPVWGLEKTLNYARQLASQEPIWSRGATRSVTAVTAGEIPLLLFGASYSIAARAERKDPRGTTQFTLVEPVPVRSTLEQAILSTSRNRHAALLWLEFMAGLEAQKLIDEHEPLVASLYSKESAAERALRGKKLSVVSWENNEELEQWITKILEAYGFPAAIVK
jgi:ABC-type Fe3+ transport system substrate-binding protein